MNLLEAAATGGNETTQSRPSKRSVSKASDSDITKDDTVSNVPHNVTPRAPTLKLKKSKHPPEY